MPETTFLHIQTRDSAPTRVLEIPGVSVRIGRGEQCEVQLGEPALAEVQCMLRRRGETWHLQPVGPPGRISIEGRAVERSRPLPLGTSVRVGDHWLTLRPADPPAVEGWGAIDPPESTAFPTSAPAEADPGARERDPGGNDEAERDRLQRWQERLEQRERWLKARQDERRWEARWKAAGANLRARAGTAAPPAAGTPPPPHRRPASPTIARPEARPRPGPPRAPASSPHDTPDARPHPLPSREEPAPHFRPPVSRTAPVPDPELAETPASKLADGDAPESRVAEPRPPRRSRCAKRVTLGVASEAPPIDEPAVAEGAGWPFPDIRAMDLGSLLRLMISGQPLAGPPSSFAGLAAGEPPVLELAPGSVEAEIVIPARVEAMESPRRLAGVPFAIGKALIGLPAPRPRAEVLEEPADEASITVAPASGLAECEPDVLEGGTDADDRRASVFGPPTAPPDPGADAPRSPGDSWAEDALDPAPDPGPMPEPDRDEGPAPVAEPGPVAEGREAGAVAWPSARIIFQQPSPRRDAQGPSPASVAREGKAPRGATPRPTPTVGREPGHWTIPAPGWLWAPATATMLLVGAAGLGLAWTWATDDQAAGVVANRFLGRGGPLPVEEAEGLLAAMGDDPAWWKTTAGHQLLRAAVADHAGADGRGRVAALLHSARGSAPAQAGVRLALARSDQAGAGPGSLAGSLGLSRDAVALAWTARRLLEAGREEAALRAYRAALELVAGADPGRLGPSAFLGERRVNRFALPGEDLMTPIVREMAERAEWSYERWAPALPPGGAAALAAARVLREKGSLDADRALDVLLAAPGRGAMGAAARAEALALKDRWEEAEAEYRRAIAAMPDDRIRRSWALNLADVCGRLNDDAKRRAAWEAAKGGAPGDEITRRVSEAQAGVGDQVTAMDRRP